MRASECVTRWSSSACSSTPRRARVASVHVDGVDHQAGDATAGVPQRLVDHVEEAFLRTAITAAIQGDRDVVAHARLARRIGLVHQVEQPPIDDSRNDRPGRPPDDLARADELVVAEVRGLDDVFRAARGAHGGRHLHEHALQLPADPLLARPFPERDHGADDPPPASNRRGDVVDGDAHAVLPPEHLVVAAMNPAGPNGAEDRALDGWIRAAVGVRVVDRRMLIPPDQGPGRPAEHPGGGRLRVRDAARDVQAVNAFAQRAQNEGVIHLVARRRPLPERSPRF
jgi:hypothetical protein